MKIHTMEFSPPIYGKIVTFAWISSIMEVKSPEISSFGREMEMVRLDFMDDRLKIWYFAFIYGSLGKLLSVRP